MTSGASEERTMREPDAPLHVSGLWKEFVPGQPVLRGVDFMIRPGEVHGLAGVNGSGKSTFVKILAGFHPYDRGLISVGGNPLVSPIHHHEVRRLGVRFVHQDKGFIAGMPVLDNMCLGRGYETGAAWHIRWSRERAELRDEIARHNIDVDLEADAGKLPVATRAKLAIIRALYCREGEQRRVIVLDEATAAMGRDEVDQLDEWIRDLAQAEQLGVLFIGHETRELCQVSDRVSVLRNGVIAATFERDTVDKGDILNALVGSNSENFYPPRDREQVFESPVLSATDLCGGTVRNLSFSVSRGEILGVTGIEGSGCEDVPWLLFDPSRKASGSITFRGRPLSNTTSIRERISSGLVLVPVDRSANGIVPQMSIRENVVQPRLRDIRKNGLLRARRQDAEAQKVIDSLRVVTTGPGARLAELSGGNQQKVVLGKWLAVDPHVLILHEPTEGIDVVTKREIFRILGEKAASGVAVIICSFEYEDLVNVCDRILVMGGGRVYMELDGAANTGDTLLRAVYTAEMKSESGGREGRTRWGG